MSQNFLKPYERAGENRNVKLIYIIMQKKADLKGATEFDTSNLAAKLDLAS